MRLLLCMLVLAAVALAPTATAQDGATPATHCPLIVIGGGNIDVQPECLPPHCAVIVIGGSPPSIELHPECL